ncbi:MAG: PolC-type DNA polymerase III [Gemmatimonadota bacterium]
MSVADGERSAGGRRSPELESESESESEGAAAVPLRSLEYVVVDVETTGGTPRYGHRVTELAAVRVDLEGRVREEFSTLIDPGRPIPAFITRLTGIDDAMVRGAPPFATVAGRVRELLDGRVFVAHNASFDWRFVRAEFERAEGRPPAEHVRRLCTVRLARRLVPEAGRRSLDALSAHFGIENDARHRALGDARATVELFARLVERLDARGVRYWHEVEEVLLRRGRGSPTVEDAPTLWDQPKET